jgi:hypothetical protein
MEDVSARDRHVESREGVMARKILTIDERNQREQERANQLRIRWLAEQRLELSYHLDNIKLLWRKCDVMIDELDNLDLADFAVVADSVVDDAVVLSRCGQRWADEVK